MSQLLDKSFDNPVFRKDFLDVVPKEIERISRLVDELLSFAKSSKPKLENVDLNVLIRSAINIYEGLCKTHNISIIKLFSDIPCITADPNQISQVLSNLILNAIDAMPAGGSITFYTGRTEERVFIEISDTGDGIRLQDIKSIFEPFFSTKKNGTGLGLAISRKLVEDMGGTIEVKSELEKGTRFRIELQTGEILKTSSLSPPHFQPQLTPHDLE